jgi:hypothetical protein
MGMARTQVPYLAAHRALLRFLNVRYWVKIAENMFNEGLVKGAPAAQGIFSLSVTSGHAGHLPLPMRRTRVGTAQSRIEKEASSSVLGTAIIDPMTRRCLIESGGSGSETGRAPAYSCERGLWMLEQEIAVEAIRRRNATGQRALRRQTGRCVGRSHPFKETSHV